MHYPKKSCLTLRLDTNKLRQSLQPLASHVLQKEYRGAFGAPLLVFPRIREIFETANLQRSEEERRTALVRLLSEMILTDILEDEITSSGLRNPHDRQTIDVIKKKLQLLASSSDV